MVAVSARTPPARSRPRLGTVGPGVGDMVADHPLTPDKLRGLVRKLNYFGGVAISKDAVELTATRSRGPMWKRSAPAASSSTFHRRHGKPDRQAAGAVVSVPQESAGGDLEGGVTLLLAAAKQQLEGGAMEIRIPAEVHYRGMLRSRELAPGMR